MKDDDDRKAGLAEMFFKINDEREQLVLVDAKDKEGRTPLQLAVANLRPRTVERLLDRGADLSSFVFPTESHFGECQSRRMFSTSKFALMAYALAVVDCLESRDYEFDRSDVLTIMKFFDEHKIFAASTDPQNDCLDDESFARKAKEIMARPSLSLHDLFQLRAEEAAKQFTHREFYEFWSSHKFDRLSRASRGICARRLCEIMCRGFFRGWALDAFLELTHCRLPILCCETIMDNLMNKDLLNICLAAGVQNDTPKMQPTQVRMVHKLL